MNMNQSKQETHLKLACSCPFSCSLLLSSVPFLFSPFLLCFSSVPLQASRCFLPSAALLCPSPPPISRLRKKKKEKTKKLPPASQPQGGSTHRFIFLSLFLFKFLGTIYYYKFTELRYKYIYL